MRFGGQLLVTENPEPILSSPASGLMHIEVQNIGHTLVFLGDETLRKATFSSAFDYQFLPPLPTNARQLHPGEIFHCRMEPNNRLYVCRIRNQIHVASATIDWRSEIAWTIVEEFETGA